MNKYINRLEAALNESYKLNDKLYQEENDPIAFDIAAKLEETISLVLELAE